MTQVAPFTALLAANSHLHVLDPVAGPVERPVEALLPFDEVMVFVAGRPCYRPIAQSVPAAAPQRSVMLHQSSLSPGCPSRDLTVAARQNLTIAFPVGIAPVAADELPAAEQASGAGEWIELTIQDAQAIVVQGVCVQTGPLVADIAAELPSTDPAGEAIPEASPLKAHAGLRELPPQFVAQGGILTTWSFTVPPRTTTIRLSSASRQPDGDPRHLGIAIYRLAMDDVPIPLDSPALVRGFHRAESGEDMTWRWTDGEALLILPPRPTEQTLSVGVTNWHLMLWV